MLKDGSPSEPSIWGMTLVIPSYGIRNLIYLGIFWFVWNFRDACPNPVVYHHFRYSNVNFRGIPHIQTDPYHPISTIHWWNPSLLFWMAKFLAWSNPVRVPITRVWWVELWSVADQHGTGHTWSFATVQQWTDARRKFGLNEGKIRKLWCIHAHPFFFAKYGELPANFPLRSIFDFVISCK